MRLSHTTYPGPPGGSPLERIAGTCEDPQRTSCAHPEATVISSLKTELMSTSVFHLLPLAAFLSVFHNCRRPPLLETTRHTSAAHPIQTTEPGTAPHCIGHSTCPTMIVPAL